MQKQKTTFDFPQTDFKSKFQFNQVRAGDFLSLVVLPSLPAPFVPKRGPAWERSPTQLLPVPGSGLQLPPVAPRPTTHSPSCSD